MQQHPAYSAAVSASAASACRGSWWASASWSRSSCWAAGKSSRLTSSRARASRPPQAWDSSCPLPHDL
ncbi:hypothetical protein ACFQZ4_40235 [Catellatospora coxensis]